MTSDWLCSHPALSGDRQYSTESTDGSCEGFGDRGRRGAAWTGHVGGVGNEAEACTAEAPE